MFTNEELRKKEHLLAEAYTKQELIRKAKAVLEGLEIEYNQIVEYCKEIGMREKEGYVLKTTRYDRREIDPALFAKEFPEVNKEFVKEEVAFLTTELANLKQSNIMKQILIKDVKDLEEIIKGNLNKACNVTVTEHTSIIKIIEV